MGEYSIKKNSPKFKEMSQLLHFSEEEAYILSKAYPFHRRCECAENKPGKKNFMPSTISTR
jgi:hypothetical protein